MNLTEVLRDGVWQSIGVAASVFAIAVSFVIYKLQRQVKELSFGVLTARRLLSVSKEIQGKVVVTYENSPVTDVWIIVIGFKNSGNTPILQSDFERPLSIKLNNQATILSVEITRQVPSNLGVVFKSESPRIDIGSMLLNPGDNLVIQILASTKDTDVTADARIVGVSKLSELNKGVRFGPAHVKNLKANLIVAAIFISAGLVWRLVFGNVPAEFMLAFFAVLSGVIAIAFIQWLIGKFSKNAMRYIDDA